MSALLTPAETTVGNGLTALGTIFTQIMTWVGSLVDTIADKPLLLLPVGIFCVGAVIGLAGRLIGR